MVKSHKDLLVWQRSMDLVESVYRLTARLPASEQFGLVAQMRRSHHLSFSRGSLLELETQAMLCLRLNYLTKDDLEPILKEIAELSKMFGSLISKLS
jgi:hypothetical protein